MNAVFRKLFLTPYPCLITGILVLLVATPIATIAQLPKEPASELSKPTEGANTKPIAQELLRAILVNPKNSANQPGQNSIQYNSKELELAIQNLNQKITANPDNEALYYQRGFLNYSNGKLRNNRGDFEKAINDFSQAIELNEKDDIAYFNRGISYYEIYSLGQINEDFDRTIENINKAIQIDPESWLEWLDEQHRNPILDDKKNEFNTVITHYISGERSRALREMKLIKISTCQSSGRSEFWEICERAVDCLRDFDSQKNPDRKCEPY